MPAELKIVLTVECDGCGKKEIFMEPCFDARVVVERAQNSGWLRVGKISEFKFYCLECRNTREDLKKFGKYNTSF